MVDKTYNFIELNDGRFIGKKKDIINYLTDKAIEVFEDEMSREHSIWEDYAPILEELHNYIKKVYYENSELYLVGMNDMNASGLYIHKIEGLEN